MRHFEKYIQKFRNYMIGRYGVDQLAVGLIVLSILLSFMNAFIQWPYFYFISYLPLIWCYFRIFSKNISKRYEENRHFMNIWTPIYRKINTYFRKLRKMFNQLKDRQHHYFTCPNCGQTLRVPRGRGKISITCGRCHKVFSRKS